LLRPSTDEDKDFTTKLDFTRTFDSGALSFVDFGLRYSQRELARTGADTRVVAEPGFDRRNLPSVADAFVRLDSFNISGAPASVPSSIMGVHTNQILSLYLPYGIGGEAINGVDVVPRPLVTAQRSFDVEEDTLNLYTEATFELELFTVNTGLRYVKTNQTSNGFAITNGEPTPISLDSNYKVFLPSIAARYETLDDYVIRASYYRSLTRPALGNLAPTEIVNGIDEGGGTCSQGNADLLPFTADNIDIGIDYYFSDAGYVAFNVFYKEIQDIIDTESFTDDRTFPRQRDNVLVFCATKSGHFS